jgi:hypothetical protein
VIAGRSSGEAVPGAGSVADSVASGRVASGGGGEGNTISGAGGDSQWAETQNSTQNGRFALVVMPKTKPEAFRSAQSPR